MNPRVDQSAQRQNSGRAVLAQGRPVQYRQGPVVDASGKFEDGSAFAGFTAFQTHLASQPENLTRALAKKLLTFATGRELGFSDRAEVERIVNESARTGYRVRDLPIDPGLLHYHALIVSAHGRS